MNPRISVNNLVGMSEYVNGRMAEWLRIITLSPILVNNHCQTLEYTRRVCDLGGLRKDLGLTTPFHSQVTVPQTHTSKERSRRALTRGIGGGGVVERFGGVLGDLPRGPKN
jgi:hypothetical protein